MRPEISVLLSVLGVALVSMPVYARGAAHRGEDPHEVQDRGSFVLGSFVRNWFYWFQSPLDRAALAVGLGPLFFNLLGVFFGIVAAAFFATGHLSLGGWAVLFGGWADVVDGRLARALGVADERGAFLDSTLDRFAEFAAFVGLAVLFRESGPGLVLVVTALGGSLLVSYARARGESVGVVCKLGVMQRAERLLLLGFGAILDPAVSSWLGRDAGALLVPVLGIVAVGTVGTAVFRTWWIAAKLR
ncbi:MAG: CDP-alcohol phosphatidyltransferase family protein [Longimicrobiales bacterium]|nr:CDP-alcohol phosphatidyltransferase family protein [Longimicrobiales bacterium]